MKESLLKKAQEAPDKQFLLNQDSHLGESLICSLNDLRALPYIENDDDLLEYEIVESED
jgi:hypothetical protein